MIFYHLSALLLICIVFGLAAVRRCSLYSPLVINSSIWLIVFIIGLIFHKRFYPLQDQAFIAWMIWFVLSSFIFFLYYPSQIKYIHMGNDIRRIPIDYSLLLLILSVVLIYRIWIVGSSGPEQFFLNLRLSAMNLEGFDTIGIVERLSPLIFALFLFENVYSRRDNRHIRLLLWCVMLLYAVAYMSKLTILTPIVAWVIIQGITGRMKLMRFMVLTPIIFASMMSLHYLRAAANYGATIVDILSLYIYSPLVALAYMDIDDSLPVGAHVLRFFYVIGNYLGVAPQPVNTIASYVWIPEPANTYTVMQPFYQDFGLLGVSLEAIFYGIFFSCLYFLSVKRGGFGLVLYSGFSIILVVQFIGELLFTNLSGNLHLLIYAGAIFLISRKVCYVR